MNEAHFIHQSCTDFVEDTTGVSSENPWFSICSTAQSTVNFILPQLNTSLHVMFILM